MTGIPSETLRTWERRYGHPKSERTPSGHRRYSMDICEQLLLVQRLLALGHKPSTVLGWSNERMQSALEQAAQSARGSYLPRKSSKTPEERILSLLLKVERMAGAELDQGLESAWSELGAEVALVEVVAPMVCEVGVRWASGRLAIHHEHFFSHRLMQFLVSKWQPISDAGWGPRLVLATPPSEEHVLGLHMAAMAFAREGAQIFYLGACTPAPTLSQALFERDADAIALSISANADRDTVHQFMVALTQLIDPQRIILGGSGASSLPERFGTRVDLGNISSFLRHRFGQGQSVPATA